MIGRKLRSSLPPGGSIAVASGVPSSARRVRNSGISRWICAFNPISCSKNTLEIGWKLWVAFSCSLRKYFSTAWRIVSDSLAASASVSIRNQVLPSGASQTYFMLSSWATPPGPASRGPAVAKAKSARAALSTVEKSAEDERRHSELASHFPLQIATGSLLAVCRDGGNYMILLVFASEKEVAQRM